jgi:hypothetical protein
MKIISIKPTWAWLIVNGYKTIENRTWRTHYRGPILVHASKKKSRIEHAAVLQWLQNKSELAPLADLVPKLDSLGAGGIVGQTTITDCVVDSDSPWFLNQGFGFVLADSTPLPYWPCKGKLGLYNITWPPQPRS